MSQIEHHSENDETVGNCLKRERSLQVFVFVIRLVDVFQCFSYMVQKHKFILTFMDKPIPREVNQLH